MSSSSRSGGRLPDDAPGGSGLDLDQSPDPERGQSELARAASVLREEQAIRARLERRLEELTEDRDRLMRTFDARAGSEEAVDEAGSASEAEIKQLTEALGVAHERMDVAAAEARRASAARKRAEQRVAVLEAELLGGSVTGSAGGVFEGGQRPPAAVDFHHRERPAAVAALLRALPFVAALAVIAIAVAVVAAVRAGDEGTDRAGTQPAPQRPAAPAAPTPPLLPCDAIVPGTESELNVMCGLRGRTLYIGAGERPLVLPGIGVGVRSVVQDDAGLVVRLRVTNGTDRLQILATEPRNLYAAIGGARTYGRLDQEVSIEAGDTAPVRLRFALDDPRIQALDAAGGRFDLGVVGFGLDPANRADVGDVGVVRLVR